MYGKLVTSFSSEIKLSLESVGGAQLAIMAETKDGDSKRILAYISKKHYENISIDVIASDVTVRTKPELKETDV